MTQFLLPHIFGLGCNEKKKSNDRSFDIDLTKPNPFCFSPPAKAAMPPISHFNFTCCHFKSVVHTESCGKAVEHFKKEVKGGSVFPLA